jgi:hypothetical protein
VNWNSGYCTVRTVFFALMHIPACCVLYIGFNLAFTYKKTLTSTSQPLMPCVGKNRPRPPASWIGEKLAFDSCSNFSPRSTVTVEFIPLPYCAIFSVWIYDTPMWRPTFNFLRRRRGSGGIIAFVKIKVKTTGLFCYAAFADTLLVLEIACCL